MSSRTIPTDVLVCGGGCAGLAAALAAARQGASTLLIERAGFAGGIITAVGLPFFDGIADAQTNRVVVRGIPLELLSAMGVCPYDARVLTSHNPTIDSIERFKILADDLLTACGSGLRVLYHAIVCGAHVSGGRISRVDVACKDGLLLIEPGQVIDATGDADVAAWSGAPVETMSPPMPLTLHFRIGKVRRGPNRAMELAMGVALRDAVQAGELPMFYGPGLSFPFAPDEATVHAVRVAADPTDAADLTRAEMQGRRDAQIMFRCWKERVPEFSDAYFITSGPYIGVRESRRLKGRHRLTRDDIISGRRFDDAVATGCWYLDAHPNQTTMGSANVGERLTPDPYDIPFGTLVTDALANLLVAGRCHSATADAASSSRVTATAMALGQAAGTAAAMAIAARRDVVELDGVSVRQALAAQGGGPFTDPDEI
ncbi:MAG: FAD-dependent oxidoreductase [Verrucomicrobia bacterium]|nr:FAD-dependent oxidoreductase [Verrucomicrobiota bacterium]